LREVIQMTRVYYVDVAIPADKKKRRDKTHAVFDGSRVYRIKKLTKLEDAARYTLMHYSRSCMTRS